MKKQTGRNKLFYFTNCLLVIMAVITTSCKEKLYDETISYKNTTDKTVVCELLSENLKDTIVYEKMTIRPNEVQSVKFEVYESETVFEYINTIILTFDNTKKVKYLVTFNGEESKTNLGNVCNYKDNDGAHYIEITEAHYNEAMLIEEL